MSISDLKRDSSPLRVTYMHGSRNEPVEVWMYEEGHGLTVVVHGVANIAIPWRKIREAVRRRDRHTKKARPASEPAP